MVPPEVLVDPQSLPEHPIMHEKLTSMEVEEEVLGMDVTICSYTAKRELNRIFIILAILRRSM